MSVEAAVMAGRMRAAEAMQDACTIAPDGAPGVIDEDTGLYVPEDGAEVYSGPCEVKAPAVQANDTEAGERVVSVQPYVVKVPVSVEGLARGQVVLVTASVLDPELAGTRLRIREVPKGSTLTARRLVCEVLT